MSSSDTDETLESFGTGIGEEAGVLAKIREWVMVDGDRLFIAITISLATFVLLLTLNQVGFISFVNDDSVTRLAGGMIAGTFSLVTLVVSINQLILSREFAAAGKARDRLGGVLEFRHDIEEAGDVPAAPAAPTALLEVIVSTINHRAVVLSETVDDHDEEVQTDVRRYTNAVGESTEELRETLEQTSFGTFGAVSAAVSYNDAWQLYAARQLCNRHEDALSEEAIDAFDDVIEAIELFTVAREHFKTTYLQRELTRFSQLTIYCGVPAILSAIIIGLLYASLTGPVITVTYLPVVVSALVAVVVSPMALLVAYILRTATVTRRTASIGPILPQKDPDAGPFDVSTGTDSQE